MADYYIDPENGDDAADGSEQAPWRLIPGQAGANTALADSFINIKNGTTSTGGTITPAANRLTYRGYGVASNVLELTLPGKSPKELRQLKVVREAGVHEGMWRLNMQGADAEAVIVNNARSGIVIEDLHAFNNGGANNSLVRAGTSTGTSANPGFTIRRSFLEGATNAGISIFKFNALVEYVKVRHVNGDCVNCIASTDLSDRDGSTDTFRYLDLQYPNYNYYGVPYGASDGDNIQFVPNTTTGVYAGKIIINDVYMVKGSWDTGWSGGFGGKQALLLHDGIAGIYVNNVHLVGTTTDANIGVLFGTLRGNVVLQNMYFGGYNDGTQTFRFAPGSNPIGTDLMATGSSLTIRNVINEALTRTAFFSCAEDIGSTLNMNGTLTFENCTLSNEYTTHNSLTYDADISLQGGDVAYGANFKLNVHNCIFNTTHVKLKLPTGVANDADYSIKNNWFKPSNSFFIGSTEYTTLTAFAAAHNAATNNLDGNLEINTTTLLPSSSTSPQVASGTQVAYRMDAQGTQRYNPPCIGAFEFIRDRGTR